MMKYIRGNFSGGKGGGGGEQVSARGPPSALVICHGFFATSITIVVLLNFIREFVQRFAVCAEMGGRVGHPEEQQREAHQRAPGVHI